MALPAILPLAWGFAKVAGIGSVILGGAGYLRSQIFGGTTAENSARIVSGAADLAGEALSGAGSVALGGATGAVQSLGEGVGLDLGLTSGGNGTDGGTRTALNPAADLARAATPPEERSAWAQMLSWLPAPVQEFIQNNPTLSAIGGGVAGLAIGRGLMNNFFGTVIGLGMLGMVMYGVSRFFGIEWGSDNAPEQQAGPKAPARDRDGVDERIARGPAAPAPALS